MITSADKKRKCLMYLINKIYGINKTEMHHLVFLKHTKLSIKL